MSVFVELDIRAGIEDLWSRTQDPVQHERWDLRFSSIEYAAASEPDGRQGFDYETRLGFGLAIRGAGETIADRDLPDGGRVSSLRFSSGSRWSLIREGRGYWAYSPTPGGVRFRTVYDYETRWGRIGRWFDRLAFRPLIGWATAWSFDRLRLWLERGIDPAVSIRLAAVHSLARSGLAAIFLWHGLVPKLIAFDPTELAILTGLGTGPDVARTALAGMGVAEILFAFALLLTWHRAAFAGLAFLFSITATLASVAALPSLVAGAFTPITLNLGLGLLAAIDLLTLRDIPSAGRCRRRPPTVAIASAAAASSDFARP
ncbi:MAG TPA: DoxX-like family protein [Candidatus Limnocylindrales bacterium]|jgi:hypothetical protein